MKEDFFRFPHIPHLEWLGEGIPRDDKMLSPRETADFLRFDVVVEEKLDGANLGISVSPNGDIRVQNRGQYLAGEYLGQFKKLNTWLHKFEDALFDAMGEELILFGEWCTARHSLDYSHLPDWLMVFDIYDRKEQRFWSTFRRDELAKGIGLSVVPILISGKTSLPLLKHVLSTQPSSFRHGPMEGLIVRCESKQWLNNRAKLVHPDFTQAIGEHWQRRNIEWNSLCDNNI